MQIIYPSYDHPVLAKEFIDLPESHRLFQCKIDPLRNKKGMRDLL